MGTRLSLRPLFHERIADRITSGAPRDRTIVSESRPHLCETNDTRIGVPTLPTLSAPACDAVPLFAAGAD